MITKVRKLIQIPTEESQKPQLSFRSSKSVHICVTIICDFLRHDYSCCAFPPQLDSSSTNEKGNCALTRYLEEN